MTKLTPQYVGGNILREVISKLENGKASDESIAMAAQICLDYGDDDLKDEAEVFIELLLKKLASKAPKEIRHQ